MAQFALGLLALLGHFALWIGLFNRLHARALSRGPRELAEKLILAALLAGLALAVAALSLHPAALERPLVTLHSRPLATAYFWLCSAVALPAVASWLQRTCRRRPPQLVSNHGQVLDVRKELGRLPCGDRTTCFWAQVPGNQILQLEITTKTLCLPQLPTGLDGLRIAHLSDLHFTGHFTRPYFELIVQQTNRLQPDLIAITGDIIDDAACLPWFDVLARLQSRWGVFCILGNHERKLSDRAPILQAIAAAGLEYLGGTCAAVERGPDTLLIAGNELPWWPPAADMQDAQARYGEQHGLRLLLAHSPDQIQWARQHRFDLMLAGHTHGGQIRLPLFGPVVSQSRYGARYASGLISVPPTLLHVSRGLSGCQPLRINCRPELSLLILRSGDAGG